MRTYLFTAASITEVEREAEHEGGAETGTGSLQLGSLREEITR
jgi:hypothetical protein